MSKLGDGPELSPPPRTPALVSVRRARTGAVVSTIALAVACSSSEGETYRSPDGGDAGSAGAGGFVVAPMPPPGGTNNLPPMPGSGGTLVAPMIPPLGGEGGAAGSELGGGGGEPNAGQGGAGGNIAPMPPPMPAP